MGMLGRTHFEVNASSRDRALRSTHNLVHCACASCTPAMPFRVGGVKLDKSAGPIRRALQYAFYDCASEMRNLAHYLCGRGDLLVSQRHDGINAHGAAGGDVASQHGDGTEQQSNADEGRQISRAHAEDDARDELRQGD